MLKGPTRRTLLVSGCACGVATSSFAQGEQYSGCMLGASAFADETDGRIRFNYGRGPDGEQLHGSSGDEEFDRALAQTLFKLSEWFDVLPAFNFYRERNGRGNAWAMSASGDGRSDGSVAYGLTLREEQFRSASRPAVHVAAVCAHEFGHIAQYKRGADSELRGTTFRRQELHADYLAGFFAGMRKLESPEFPAAEIAQAQFNAGDHYYRHMSHHGTPEERGRAVVAGFHAAFTRRLTFDRAFEEGVYAARAW